jgi:hypothetical protein
MITVATANRNANTGTSTTTPGIVDHMAEIGTVHCLTPKCSGHQAHARCLASSQRQFRRH